ncbi:sugar-transfer associated ATP-grasp domain-containing protein [Oceanobacillus caeni]|uniref:Alpha-L-glutamate ligase-related protein ATP-grasp domain-containing protein n=1 Tax=Oceanobacillus caeni TaxID=405946 RepID=A0ABR5MK49_9BACI|nr:sugar-transfer associated ATP-grasp domain-containing protein [Oceanobacillus caeni]KPH76067.1 hypothetical protein AFL42_07110 [Oceanobacillus caeni]
MNTGENYNKIVHGSGISKVTAQFSTLKSWLSHPEMKKSHQLAKRSRIIQNLDFLSSIIIYGTTLEDYLLYEFYNKSHKERKTYVTGRKLHNFFDEVNNKDKTDIFIDKNKFAQLFSKYLGRKTFSLDLDGKNTEDAKKWLRNMDVIFAKPTKGAEGKGVTRLSVTDIENTIQYCLENKLGTLEEPIVQHPDMNILYPDAINTVRLITFIENNKVKLLGATLRIGNGGYIDNAGSGGIFASIDINEGKLDSVAFNKSGKKHEKHPITNQMIKGFQIPLWPQVTELCKKAALEIPDVKSVGWDVALTEKGPILIEGNDRWSRAVWQLPKQKGLYHLIQQ